MQVRELVKALPKSIGNLEDGKQLNNIRDSLIQETTELMNIFGVILRKIG